MDVFFEGIETYMGIINVYKSTICKKNNIFFSKFISKFADSLFFLYLCRVI